MKSVVSWVLFGSCMLHHILFGRVALPKHFSRLMVYPGLLAGSVQWSLPVVPVADDLARKPAAGAATCLKKLLREVWVWAVLHSLFYLVPDLLGHDLWKVTSLWTVILSTYRWLFQEWFPRNAAGLKRLLRTVTA